MAVKLLVTNKKGGVGKTTTTINLASFLAEMGFRVLALDFDPQSHSTIGLGGDYAECTKSLKEVFEGKVQIGAAIKSAYRNLDLLPARPDLGDVLNIASIVNHTRRSEIIKFKLVEIEEKYDFMVIDTPPAESSIITDNCLSIANFAIIPVQMERLPIDGLSQMLGRLARAKEQWLNPDIGVLGLLGTFISHTNNCRAHMELLEQFAESSGIRVFKSQIRRNVALAEAVNNGLPVNVYAPKSYGSADYRALTEEVIAVLKQQGVELTRNGEGSYPDDEAAVSTREGRC